MIEVDDRTLAGSYSFRMEAQAETITDVSEFTIELMDPCYSTSFQELSLLDMESYAGEDPSIQQLIVTDSVSE